ncbi:MAG: 4-aminobutyrate aminotransferase / (S)-3-amino-2-methylpropionate transaminase / 5-aminovalerate [Actinomycetota bacterium]|jgi:4-aminobutyrate aminotransferase/(S)-3-amino-2-methylpropionate transaminase|nr:4-aminobutyrate aminotransferase / (S)-3-amino-2-methylpropionate transaminase / 5-aminovalerate [Actinomycetota bacterium]
MSSNDDSARDVGAGYPGPISTELFKRREEAVPRGVFNTTTIFIAGGEGARVTDVDGNRYIDLAGGLGVLNVGRGNERVVQAVHDQVDKFLHECQHVALSENYVELAETLNRITPGDHPKKTMLANSGAEAVENAVKISRYSTERDGVVAFSNAFHGRTLLGMTMTAKDMPYRHGFGPFAPEVHRVPFAYCYRCPFGLEHPSCGVACADYAADVIDSQIGTGNVAAMVVEPVQGEGGFVVAPDDYLPALKQICSERDILFVADEVQSGMGRTGKMFAVEHYGVVPDIVATAKSLGAGMPISAVTGPAEVMDAPHVGGLGGTYGGNPVACAAALAVIAELTETDLLARAEAQGRIIRARLNPLVDSLNIVGEVRGLGPMVGIELVVDERTKEPNKLAAAAVVKRCHESGVLIMKAGTYDNVVRLLAPLVISDADLHEGLDVLVDALEEANKGAN